MWSVEYAFRKLFHCSHDEFMDTPLEEIEWLMRIHNVHIKAENEANKRASQA